MLRAFGGDKMQVSHLPITKGWNYIVRLCRPGKAILDGDWEFPQAQPVA